MPAKKYRLRATRDQRYNTRMLRAGDEFETGSRAVRAIYLSKGGVEDITDAPAPTVSVRNAPVVSVMSEPSPTRSEIRRMSKSDLADFLNDSGVDADEEADTREELLDRALALR